MSSTVCRLGCCICAGDAGETLSAAAAAAVVVADEVADEVADVVADVDLLVSDEVFVELAAAAADVVDFFSCCIQRSTVSISVSLSNQSIRNAGYIAYLAKIRI